MDHKMELKDAREQLQFAREHLQCVKEIKSHADFKKWWQAFRTCITTACNSADHTITGMGYAKGSHISQPLVVLRKQPETRYLIQARNVSFHKTDPVSEVELGWIKMSPGDIPEDIEQPDGSFISPACTLLRIQTKSPTIKLLPVTSRQVTYNVPLRDPVAREAHSATSLGEKAIGQVQYALDQVEKLLVKHSKRGQPKRPPVGKNK